MISSLAIVCTSKDHEGDTDLEEVIADQVEAFQMKQTERAFAQASFTMRHFFDGNGGAAAYEKAMSFGFPMLAAAAEIEFEDRYDSGRMTVQIVKITTRDRAQHWMKYEMEKTSAGWHMEDISCIDDLRSMMAPKPVRSIHRAA